MKERQRQRETQKRDTEERHRQRDRQTETQTETERGRERKKPFPTLEIFSLWRSGLGPRSLCRTREQRREVRGREGTGRGKGRLQDRGLGSERRR